MNLEDLVLTIEQVEKLKNIDEYLYNAALCYKYNIFTHKYKVVEFTKRLRNKYKKDTKHRIIPTLTLEELIPIAHKVYKEHIMTANAMYDQLCNFLSIDKIINLISKHSLVFNTTDNLKNDLKLDTFDITEIAVELENEFKISLTFEDVDSWNTVDDVINNVNSKLDKYFIK